MRYNRTMKCVLIAPRARSWMQDGRLPRILHLFDQVINLTDENGNVVSITTPTLGPGPFAIVLDENFPGAAHDLDLQSYVTINNGDNSITIGQLHIATNSASTWNPKPEWHKLQRGFENSDLLSDANIFNLPRIEHHFQVLLSAILAEDFIAAQRGTMALAGLGSGLTPAGDDVLTGLMYALWVWMPGSKWLDLIPEWAVPLTTTLSAAYLRAAGCGEATIHWHNLAAGNPDAVDQILAIGHSSGKDAWAGFSLTFRALSRQY
jgi:hypothetical protein